MKARSSALPGVLAGLLVAGGCQKLPSQTSSGGASPAPAKVAGHTPYDEIAGLISSGQADVALSKLQAMPPDPDTLYYEGAAWAKKAELAPLPTPPPSPAPPVAPEFKNEELQALEFYEKALAAKPDHALAHFGEAELLAPHAARRYEQDKAPKKHPPLRKGKPTPEPEVQAVAAGPDFSVDRVIRAYQGGIQGAQAPKEAMEAMARFCVRVGRPDDADVAFKELIRRDNENPAPFIRYGDFLATEKKDPQGAVEQYRQALIWKADDDTTKAKIADVYITMGVDSYSKLQYAASESRFREAQKYVTDPRSPQGMKIQDYMSKLGAIRKLPAAR